MYAAEVSLCLQLLSADNLIFANSFGTRSGPTNVRPDLDPNCMTLMVIMKELCSKLT